MKKITALQILSIVAFPFMLLFMNACQTETFKNQRKHIDLAGNWFFENDPGDQGMQQNWFSRLLTDSVLLPGTMDENHKGNLNHDSTTFHLTRIYNYEGPAWYQKQVIIPDDWKNKCIRLTLERTRPSMVWVDNQFAGKSIILESPQNYDLTRFLTPGKHTLTLRIDNNLKLTPYGNIHMYSDDTQTNWNGILGSIFLDASDSTHFTGLQVFPDVDEKKIRVMAYIANPQRFKDLYLTLQVAGERNGKKTFLKSRKYHVVSDSLIQAEFEIGRNSENWDEYHQPLYRIQAVISQNHQVLDAAEAPFGMRKFSTLGTHFAINGRIIFLRGKHDACVFPLTGHPPMDTAGWTRIFRIAKSYGINHYRFHTWCPPEAAFEAADREGIYLQPELPFWGNLENDTLVQRMMAEALALLKSYANHPSFVMFSAGNEIWGRQDKVEDLIATLKKVDSRPLYTQGSNNNIGYTGPVKDADFQVAARTPFTHDTILTHTRLTQAFVDSRDGGILNTQLPSTMVNFDYAVAQTKIPLVGHEVGQYQIFPDFDEIKKYTGILQPRNLEVFREKLQKSGMFDEDKAFTKASGALSALCYRAEIEAALRTKGFAGFQLLDLQDYPGQGTALVGILDAFMDSKNVIDRKEWLHFCNDVVPLLLFEKYCWTTNDTFSARVEVANYSDKNLKGPLLWSLTDNQGKVLESGAFRGLIGNGGVQDIGKISIPFAGMTAPQRLNLTLSVEGTVFRNSYPVWVYPETALPAPVAGIAMATRLNPEIMNKLEEGGKVLLFPEAKSVIENSVPGLFPPDFWNFGMFRKISEGAKKPVSPGTLGILTNPKHPLFRKFPTEFYSDWQWWTIIKNSNPLILNSTDKLYRPIVQVIDNCERDYKLGLIFECRVGKGKLLVCMARLNDMPSDPAAAQLYRSLFSYMQSAEFNPEYQLDEHLLRELMR